MKNSSKDQLKHDKEYAEFLKKRLDSSNFKRNVSKEEFDKTKMKYDKVKQKLKLLGVAR